MSSVTKAEDGGLRESLSYESSRGRDIWMTVDECMR